jgi:membrane-associated phospholipid phosphatase
MLDASSIQVNTFPSGHVAEALAAALLVWGAPAPIVVTMSIAALAIAAGAVLGRYHYAVDAFAGWIVALVVYCVTSA